VAVLAAGSSKAETTVRFLCIKTIKGGLDAGLFHVQQHFPHGWIRGTGDNILLGREFSISAHAFPLAWDHAIPAGLFRVRGG
jgi:hypothetical protein